MRYLCDFLEPLRVREIAAATSINAGNVSRLLELLARESLISRDRGAVSFTNWEALIKRWAADIEEDRQGQAFLEPHGLKSFNNRLRSYTGKYAITGAFASAQLAPAAMPIATDIYVIDIDSFAKDLELRRSERVGNVRLIEAPDRVVFDRTTNVNGLHLASPSQIAADLLTLPKRSEVEYEAFIEWMKENEHEWRR